MVDNFEELLRETKTLSERRVTLREFKLDDCNDVLVYGSDELSLKYAAWGGVKTLEESVKNMYEYYFVTPGVYAIELNETHKCIGGIDIRIIPQHGKARLGFILNRHYWNKGYMTEALSVVLSFCFKTLEVNRVEATYFAGNIGSGRVMEKCGMTFEGIAKEQEKVKGVFRDAVHYGILKSQWITHSRPI